MKLLISCVAEDTPAWAEKVRLLSLSIRRFGGALADAPFIANFVGSTNSAKIAGLDRLGVDVRRVLPLDARCPWANKLRMLEMPEILDCDVLLALDCDTLVMGDVRPLLSVDALCAVSEIPTPLPERGWRIVFDEFGLNPAKCMIDPTNDVTSHVDVTVSI